MGTVRCVRRVFSEVFQDHRAMIHTGQQDKYRQTEPRFLDCQAALSVVRRERRGRKGGWPGRPGGGGGVRSAHSPSPTVSAAYRPPCSSTDHTRSAAASTWCASRTGSAAGEAFPGKRGASRRQVSWRRRPRLMSGHGRMRR